MYSRGCSNNRFIAEEDLAYALTVLPTSASSSVLPSSSSTTPLSSTVLPSSPSSSSTPTSSTPPLAIKSETPAEKTEETEHIPVYTEQKEAAGLECVAKQLCANELVVVTTIYCCYSNSKTLPEGLMSEEEQEYTEDHIQEILCRVDEVPCSSEMTSFIHNLVANTTAGPDIAATLTRMLERRAPAALFISVLFVRSLVKYLTLQLTNIGPRECLNDMPEYRLALQTTKLLQTFG